MYGADDFEAIALFGQQKEALLRRYLFLPNGTPSVDTFIRVFERLDVAQFSTCFMVWMQEILPPGRPARFVSTVKPCAVPAPNSYTSFRLSSARR